MMKILRFFNNQNQFTLLKQLITMNIKIIKKHIYIVFGVLPATFFIFLIFLLPPSIFTLGALAGTVGLYSITFSKLPNSVVSVMLLIPGQVVMALFIPWNRFFFSISFHIFDNLIWWLMMFGPILVALHYQLTYIVSRLLIPSNSENDDKT